jgi:hypothetical protein
VSKFLGHIPCPKCGSKDNLGEYDDHFYCFGCSYSKKKQDIASIRARIANKDIISDNFTEMQVTYDIPQEPLRWLLGYGLCVADITDAKIAWNAEKQLLVLVNMPDYWQGRSFDPNSRQKYLSSGKKPIIYYGIDETCVLVEDIVSAIRVSKAGVCGIPLLGSSIPQEWVRELSGRFKKLIVWLDRDKATNSVKIAREFRQRGIESWSVITEDDPKDYSKQEILEWLKRK